MLILAVKVETSVQLLKFFLYYYLWLGNEEKVFYRVYHKVWSWNDDAKFKSTITSWSKSKNNHVSWSIALVVCIKNRKDLFKVSVGN